MDNSEESSEEDEAREDSGPETGKVATIDDVIVGDNENDDFNDNNDKFQFQLKVQMFRTLRCYWQGVANGYNTKLKLMKHFDGRPEKFVECLSFEDRNVRRVLIIWLFSDCANNVYRGSKQLCQKSDSPT